MIGGGLPPGKGVVARLRRQRQQVHRSAFAACHPSTQHNSHAWKANMLSCCQPPHMHVHNAAVVGAVLRRTNTSQQVCHPGWEVRCAAASARRTRTACASRGTIHMRCAMRTCSEARRRRSRACTESGSCIVVSTGVIAAVQAFG